VGGDVGGGCDKGGFLGEEVPDVAELREEEEDPRLGVLVGVNVRCRIEAIVYIDWGLSSLESLVGSSHQ
jgi:hypothetical protein